MNWIHPFADGNGRTSRIVSYLILSIKLQSVLPGTPTIPDQISVDKKPYYEALEFSDEAYKNGRIFVSKMEQLIESMLSQQLLNAVKDAAI